MTRKTALRSTKKPMSFKSIVDGSKNPLGHGITRKKAMKKVGRKTNGWSKIRRELISRFELCGIRGCELRLDGCMGNFGTAFMHKKRRRHLTQEGLYEVCIGCAFCHQATDDQGDEVMFLTVTEAINRRSIQP